VASIERTAYPRFRHEPNARELQDLFTPAPDEVNFARSFARSDEHLFASSLRFYCSKVFNTWAISPKYARFPLPSSIMSASAFDCRCRSCLLTIRSVPYGGTRLRSAAACN
jgi:hypothetical protein